MRYTLSRLVLLSTILFIASTGPTVAGAVSGGMPLVRGVVSDAATTALTRDLPGALARSHDEGAISDATALPHVNLALKRPAYRQAALDTLTHEQYVRGSANYHRWLTPGALRAYGPDQADIVKVAGWLRSHGLTVNRVSPSGMVIDFGGSAGKVAAAFHTRLHQVLYRGEAHVSNVTAPEIPAALAPVVTGVTLANFFPKPAMVRRTPSFTIPTQSGPYYAVTPSDFATIYNLKPLRGSNSFFKTPITGQGVTLAMVEETQIQNSDWNTFRQAFGLAGYSGTLTQVNPSCTSPGTNGDEGEAALDTEWSTAVAPDAAIIEASCAGTPPLEFGVFTTLQSLVENGTPATIFSISYEIDEVALGFAFEQMWTNLLQEGAAEGKAIFVAAGDNGVSADRNQVASDGLFVNGLADSAYNVSVGGTDFYDTALGENSEYWHTDNGKYLGSAVSYIPEIPWDNSCASSILWTFLKYSGPYALCNSGQSVGQIGVGGSGSQSDYYTKPDWQSTGVLGVPNDGVRDQPDVSLFAANGIWGHFYEFCMSDQQEGGSPCKYNNLNDIFGNAAGGTSFGSPAFAGIAALIQETNGNTPLGNPAPVFYAIAKAQFTTPLGLSGCNSTLGNKISSACAFNYVTAGNISEPCYKGTPNCITDPASTKGIGVLAATVGGKQVVAYPAKTGYSLATGLGTVNVTNLLYNYYIGL